MSNINAAILELETKLFSLHPNAEELYTLIGKLKLFNLDDIKPFNMAPTIVHAPNAPKLVYDKNAPVAKKILFAIQYWGEAVKVSVIDSLIKEYEPDFDKGYSTPLRVLKEDGKIDIFNPTGSNRDAHYGLKDWFDGENQLKESFKPRGLLL